MSEVILRGDAIAKAKKIKANFRDFGDQDLARITIPNSGKFIEYRGTSSSDTVEALATLINGTKIPEFKEILATASGDNLTLEARTAGKPFFVTFETEESSSVNVSIVETVAGEEPTNEVQRVRATGTITGGTLTRTIDLGSGDETSSAFAYDADAATVKAAYVAGMGSVSEDDLDVTGTGTDHYCLWKGDFSETEVAEGSLDVSSLTGNGDATLTRTVVGRGLSDEVQMVKVIIDNNNLSDFIYTLSLDGQTTARIDQDDDAAAIKAKLEALSTIGSGNCEVYGTQRPNLITGDFKLFVRFTGDLAGLNVSKMVYTPVGNTLEDSHTVKTVVAGGSATRDEITHIDIGDPSAGSYIITVDEQDTASISATTAENSPGLKSKLESLSTVDSVTVWGDQFSMAIVWGGTDSDTDVDSPTVTPSSLTGGSVVVSEMVKGEASVNEQWELVISGQGGTFEMGDGTDSSTLLAYDISAATLETEIETDLGEYPGVTVTGTGSDVDPFVIEVTNPAATDINLLTADGANLTGAGSEITEVQAHTSGVSEQLTITIDAGVTAGTWLAEPLGILAGPFSWDEKSSVIQDELEAVYGSGNVAVSGSDGGPWTVDFQGDLANQDIAPITLDGDNLESAAGDESIKVVHLQQSAGPNHANDPANWVGSRVPETGDHLRIEDGVTDLLYGLNWLDTFTVDTASDRLTITSHDFADGQKVRVKSDGTLPSGLSAGTDYYVIFQDDNKIRLSATRGGSAVNITDTGTGTHTIQVELLLYTKSSMHTGKIGLSKRNTDGDQYYEYRNRAFRFGVLSSGDKKITVGNGEGSGSSRHIMHNGDSEIDLVIYKTGGSDEPGVPAFQHTGENSQSLVTVHEAECGFAFDAGDVSQYRKIVQHGGIVTLGNGHTNTDYLKTDGEFLADEANFTGTLTIVG